MTSESAGSEGLRWLLQPPAAGEIQIHVAVGDGTELTPRVRAALETLVSTLLQAEVQGYAAICSPRCPMLQDCARFGCDAYHNCSSLTSYPCLADVRCQITNVAF